MNYVTFVSLHSTTTKNNYRPSLNLSSWELKVRSRERGSDVQNRDTSMDGGLRETKESQE